MERLTITRGAGYASLELNNVAFRRDGRIEAQCKSADPSFVLENGMILAVDNVSRTVSVANPTAAGDQIFALNYSAEHMYDERANGLADFKLEGSNDFLPRLGYLSVGDKFTTNCVCYDTAAFASESALKSAIEAIATTPVYGGISDNGAIALLSAAPTVGPVLKVVAGTTVPNGDYGVKFQVIKD